jgi:outer membrane protein insertion porin family
MQSTINRYRVAHFLTLAFIIGGIGSSLVSCTATKFLKEGETFYDGAEMRFEMPQGRIRRKAVLEKELDTYITPRPNKKFLGSRPGAWFYYIAGTPKKEKGGIRNFIRNKLGAKPVLLSDATPKRTAEMLQGQVRNDGYFRSTVSHEIETHGKKSKVIYNITLYKAYRLRNIEYPKVKDSVYAKIINNLYEESLLDSNQRYDLERMQAEQERIEREVENWGIYYFDDRYLVFEADSTVGKRKVDLQLKLEPDIPDRAKKIFFLDTINVYPNYTITTDTTKLHDETETYLNGYNYVDNKNSFRPEIITRVINLKKGNTYSREAQELTLNHLMGLGVFKFVNIKFSESPRTDSALLKSFIYLTPLKKNSLRAEVQAVSKSNNFVGPGVTLSFTNRNLLRGAELFQLKLHTAYEVQINSQTSTPLNSFEAGMEATLTVPRFISPIRIDYSSSRFLPKTQFKLGLNIQNRVRYFRLNTFNIAYGYNWRENEMKSHELFPVDINFIQTITTPEFDGLLRDNALLASSFENQFIIGTRYSYTLNTQLAKKLVDKFEEQTIKTHTFYLNASTDVAGNLIHAIQSQFKKDGEAQEPYQIFNNPYSQYVRGEVDFRHYWQFDEHNKLASRVVFGSGYALGNSTTMPYIKQFSIGGSNSIRAFPARSVGPGTYNVRTDTSASQDARLFIDQRGDIKIEANIEYRFDLIKSLKGAVFTDAGNIWLNKEDSTRQGGKFRKETFMKEFAVGAGVGLRMDFSFFVLRVDVAFPIRKPFLPENERWVIRQINFGSSEWRKENLVFNIAIGYPF